VQASCSAGTAKLSSSGLAEELFSLKLAASSASVNLPKIRRNICGLHFPPKSKPVTQIRSISLLARPARTCEQQGPLIPRRRTAQICDAALSLTVLLAFAVKPK